MVIRGTMSTKQKFRISSALKDIIGRDLITNDSVAMFELVKNSFDAYAKNVSIEFDENSIIIVDDGKGMSRDDILSKWLFVAYSAKRTGEEDLNLSRDYRDEISIRRGYAGNKGIGRFSCDRLGERLELFSKTRNSAQVEHLVVDWTSFEQDAKTEFATIDTILDAIPDFPKPNKIKPPSKSGTMLIIRDLRSTWDFNEIDSLRAYLAKLIDPFQTTKGATISTAVVDEDWPKLEGPVGNDIIDLLDGKTAKLTVRLRQGVIRSVLHDRGALIYEIEEPLARTLEALNDFDVDCDIYFLNRSAKHTFTSRMGVQPVQFGNVFLFVNGFRVFPVGEPNDDTFGIGRRKQQGVSRYLGLRDILGKVDVRAPQGALPETSSRNAGLIETPSASALYEFVMKNAVQRLERYVVDVNWADALDQASDDASGLKSDTARARIIRIVQALAGSKNITLLDYDRELIDVVNERSSEFEESMTGLAVVAQQTGDEGLLARVERARLRYEEQKRAAEEARATAERETAARREAEQRARAAELRATEAATKLERVEKQAQMLLHAQEREDDELTLMHHQVIIYATEVQALVRRSLRRLGEATPPLDSIKDDLEQISWQNSRILSVTRIATQANFKLNADKIQADIIQYLEEYTTKIATLYGDIRKATFETSGLSQNMTFSPIDISIVVDNLFSNAGKADARHINFLTRKAGNGLLEIVVSDDGKGIDTTKVDSSKIFERGYSGSARGSGLGLYHIKHVLEQLGGSIRLDPERQGDKAQFIIRLPKGGKDK
ncbi:ATP-binding protein [Stakelama sediminis]